MTYTALYRRWRPLVFEDVVEQEHVVKTLKYSVKTGRISHAYLFCGTRGTGKTSMAHILSRAINCLNPQDGNPCNECEICRGIMSGGIMDIIEIDAASNNSVDNVREIRDEVVYSPSRAKYKVYIIDEVHMLSSGAFNALLKTLEEPPGHTVFILATTEPHKLPATVLSRCQRFDFRRISVEGIMDRLDKISSSNGITVQKEALKLIAKMSEGALRDAISLLDQCISLGKSQISLDDVISVAGLVKDAFTEGLVDVIKAGDVDRVLSHVDELVMSGKDISRFVSDLLQYYRNLLLCKVACKPEDVIDAPHDALMTMRKQSENFDRREIIYILKELSILEANLKWANNPRILLEVALIKLCCNEPGLENENIGERLEALERKVANMELTASGAGIINAKPSGKSKKACADITVGQDGLIEPDGANASGGVDKIADIGKTPAAGEIAPACETGAAGAAAGMSKTVPSGEIASTGAPGRLDLNNRSVKPVDAVSSDLKPFGGWNGIIDELKKNGRMALYSYLLDTKAVLLDDKHAGIIFPKHEGVKKDFISKAENLQVIERMAGKLLGRDVKVKCFIEDELNFPCESCEERDELVEKGREIAKIFDAPLNIIML